ncbi:hypothetical protein ACSBR2_035813 [Camellia fascicularis]
MALSVVTFLVTKLSSMLDNELKLLGGVNREFVFIRDELESIRAFLRVADAMEENDLELQTWVKQVRDVARDIEDVLDEFMLRFARQHQRGIFGSVYKIHYQIKNMKARHQIASEVQDIKRRVVEIAERRKREFHGNIYEMKALSPEESWILFCKKTFQEKDCPRHLIELSERILGRCEGLPLAIVAIAGVLASKDYNRVDEWELVNRSLGAEVEGSDMMKILLLSYNDLPYYLKSCFLYLSIFPEDHLIGWMSLIRLWVAEGFVEVKHGKTPEEVAEAYIYELLNRSLIQDDHLNLAKGL